MAVLPNPYLPGSDSEAFGPGGYAGLDSSAFDSVFQSIGAYQKHIEEREDSAYQRMAEDMKKAGLNPWTGVSSGGSTSSQNNAVSDALNGLIGMLDYNLQATKYDNQYKKGVSDSTLSWLKVILPFALGL